jgi:hypothetical protein
LGENPIHATSSHREIDNASNEFTWIFNSTISPAQKPATVERWRDLHQRLTESLIFTLSKDRFKSKQNNLLPNVIQNYFPQ